jgi:hypothetical protein
MMLGVNAMKTGLVILSVVLLCTVLAVWSSLRVRTEKTAIRLKRIEEVPREAWEALAQKRLFFGHKSIGRSVMEGVELLQREYPLLRPVEIGHGSIGKNFDPQSKLDVFEATATGNEQLDGVMLKFCYVDVNRLNDADRLIRLYQERMGRMKEANPAQQWIHFTLPIESPPLTFMAYLKEAAKRALLRPGIVEKNAARHAYSEQLITLAGEEPVFDIALVESIGPDGRRHYYSRWGKKIYCMAPAYTKDGGHLNEKGRRVVAEQFLIFLAEWATGETRNLSGPVME